MRRFWLALSQNFIGTLVAFGLLIAVNALAERFPIRCDLTDEKEFSIAPATQNVLNRLEDRLVIKTFFSQNLPPQMVQIKDDIDDRLKEFQAVAKQSIIIEAADPDSNEIKEQETQQLGIIPVEINVIEKDKREVKKAYMGLALYYRDKREVIPVIAQTENLEYLLDMALLKMTVKELPRIGILLPPTQNDEPEGGAYRIFKEVVDQMGGFQIVSFNEKNLARLNLKSLLIVEPREIPQGFVDQLDGLLTAGVNILVFAGHVSVDNMMIGVRQPLALDGWFKDKGIGISQSLLLDPMQSTQASFKSQLGQLYLPYPFWVRIFQPQMNLKHPVTSRLEEVVFPWSNVIEPLPESASGWQSETLISSSKTGFLQPGDEPNVDPQYLSKMTELPEMGERPLSVALSKAGVSGKIYVTAGHYLLQDNFIQQAPVNAMFLQNLTEYASWGDQIIGVRSRGKTNRPLTEVLESTKSWIKWGHVLGVPLVAILCGLLGLAVLRARRQKLIARVLA